MPKKSLPSPELLRKLLRYDPDTGKLYWRERSPEMFSGDERRVIHTCNWWNSRFAGKEAFTTPQTHGHLQGDVFGVKLKAHRVIMAMVNNNWPEQGVDHINGNPSDNRICNLRLASHLQNMRNRCRPKNNSSGVVGVYWFNRSKKWQAQINVNRKKIHLGFFDRKEDAIEARKRADIFYGFHENHGRKSNPLPCKPNDV